MLYLTILHITRISSPRRSSRRRNRYEHRRSSPRSRSRPTRDPRVPPGVSDAGLSDALRRSCAFCVSRAATRAVAAASAASRVLSKRGGDGSSTGTPSSVSSTSVPGVPNPACRSNWRCAGRSPGARRCATRTVRGDHTRRGSRERGTRRRQEGRSSSRLGNSRR